MFRPSARFAPLAFLAAVAMTCLQGAAFAGTPIVPTGRTADVSVADLRLADPADVARLDQRIARAAERVCRPDDSRDLRAVAGRAACKRAAIAAATERRDVLVAAARSGELAGRTPARPGVD
jgi:UrcA family protein